VLHSGVHDRSRLAGDLKSFAWELMSSGEVAGQILARSTADRARTPAEGVVLSGRSFGKPGRKHQLPRLRQIPAARTSMRFGRLRQSAV
jgi:hypothetical protein